jgi:hypothetical protein
MGTACSSLDQTLQVGEMIVGGHVIGVTEELIGQAIVTGVNDNENVVTTDGLQHQTLGITALETGACTGNDKGFLVDTDFLGPVDQMAVDELGQLLSTGAGNQTQLGNLIVGVEKDGCINTVVGHSVKSSITNVFSSKNTCGKSIINFTCFFIVPQFLKSSTQILLFLYFFILCP